MARNFVNHVIPFLLWINLLVTGKNYFIKVELVAFVLIRKRLPVQKDILKELNISNRLHVFREVDFGSSENKG